MKFEWDINKAITNLSKHNISFDEAQTIFEDPYYIDFYDPDYSIDEHRYIIIGYSNRQRLLMLSYTEKNDRIRLISARETTQKERQNYEHK